MSTERDVATGLLNQICEGNTGVTTDLFPVIYDQLRAIAASLLRQERSDHTLQPTALVHEAYLRLVDLRNLNDGSDEQARQHFLALAARAMRRILVEHARSRGCEKRGGEWNRVTLDESISELRPMGRSTTLLDLESALEQLEQIDPRLVQAAELRLFGGLSVRELAPCLGLSLTRSKVVWASARAMLAKLLEEQDRADAGR
jgi:RNA polymerase sigma factor (TIGR02999 family)